MARSSTECYDLSETERRDPIKAHRARQAAAQKYCYMLLADKRKVELVWKGKTREVCTAILPFQTLEHIDEPRKETKGGTGGSPVEQELFYNSGRQTRGWPNKLICGDRDLEMTTATQTYAKPGRYTIAVKVIDIFGNHTMKLVPVNVS